MSPSPAMDRESPRSPPLAQSLPGVCLHPLAPRMGYSSSLLRVPVSLLVLPVLQPVPPLTLLSDPRLVLDSALPQHMLQLVCSGLKAGMGAAVEFAWCLHYIICR